jgi:type I restriction enzyme S subunit
MSLNVKWPTVSLSDLLRLERRKVKVEPEKLYQEIGIYCFGRGIFHKTPRTGFEVGDKDLFLMKEGDFILQVTFAWEGAIAIVSAAEDGMYGSTRYPTFRVDETRCEPKFLLNYFKTEEGLQQLVKICPGSAGRNRVLSIKRIPEVQVPLPPLAEQQRVVARIEELAAQIHEARTLRHQAAEEAEVLTEAWSRRILGTFEKSEWKLIPLQSVCSIFIDCDHKTPDYLEDGIPLLRPRDIKPESLTIAGTVKISEAEHEKRCERHRPAEGDIVYSRELSFGNAAMIPKDCVVSLGQGTMLVRADETKVGKRFLLKTMNAPVVREQAVKAAKGAAHPHVNLKDIRAFGVPVPSLAEQRRIVAELDALQAEVDALKRLQAETAAELDALLPALLDRAFKADL